MLYRDDIGVIWVILGFYKVMQVFGWRAQGSGVGVQMILGCIVEARG